MDNTEKICVYAICKNESKFIDRWVKSLQNEADYVVVLDTGSDDDSVEKLKKYEPFVKVEQFDYFSNLGYFRFDKARNDSLKLVPLDTDICVVLDLDQVPRKGWANILRNRFKEGYNDIRGFIVDHDEEGNITNQWQSKNAHSNSSFWIWDRIIHEGIDYYGNKEDVKMIFDENFIINHYPDQKKDRSLYMKLLNYAVETYPTDAYYGIYHGIELSARYSKQDAAESFRRCLRECNFDNDIEIMYQIYINLAITTDDFDEAIASLYEAKELDIDTRRLYNTMADIYEENGRIDEAIKALETALTIHSNSNDWREDASLYNGLIEDRLSLFYYYQKQDYLKAIEYSVKAMRINPYDERLINNYKFFSEKYLETMKGNEDNE